jgi:HAD superfamily hydrolase (TIGR01509 family)
MIEAVIFDFDGVVGDTMTDNYTAWKNAFATHGFDLKPSAYYRLEGMGRHQIADYLIADNNLDTSIANDVVEAKELYYKQHNTFRLYDHIIEIFHLLKSRGIPVAIVTGASRARISEHLSDNIRQQLSALITADDVTDTKPHPEPYLKAVAMLQKQAKNCLVIENAILGVQAAKAAGCLCYALETTLGRKELMLADEIFSGHRELLNKLERTFDHTNTNTTMNIQDIKNEFKNNQISKVDFINKMHEFHKVLFDFSNSLAGTEIAKIEIEDNKVVFTSRATDFHPGGAKFHVDILDKRITPIDTFNFDMYEQEDSEMLYKLVSANDTIFDIGANIGWYSNHLSKKLPAATIYSFEPIPETFAQLKRNTELNKAENITLNNMAFSDAVQPLTFYYSPTITGASSSVNITENDSMVKLECQANTIDNFVKEKNIAGIDFIKCDVEGAELMVYKGGAATIEAHKPIVFTEMLRKWAAKFNYHPNDIIAFYKQFGYNCYTSHNGKLIPIETVTDETMETNFFFLHPVKHAGKIADLS